MNSKKLANLFLFLIALQALVNLIGALGPELGFDALWYHLTNAKLFLQRRSIAPISGNLLYWSGLPRLAEILYALALSIWDERLTKLIHWFFGLLSAYLIYRLARRRYPRHASLAASLLFYSTLLVGWLSTSSYIDLMVTAFLLIALTAQKWWSRGLSLILAGATKFHAVFYSLAITLVPWSLLGILPFSLVNYKTTGNLFYPFFENFGFESDYFTHGFLFWLSRPARLFFDPIFRVGPVILILFILSLKKKNPALLKIIGLVFLIWYLGPGSGFGRFALFLLALLAVYSASLFSSKKIPYFAVSLILLQAIVGITGRAWANQKYLPVILGQQTKTDFLTQNLKFHFGDFYDIDGYFSQNIKPTDKVLVYGIHNLYYLDFPFDHHTWADPDTSYTHILVGDNLSLPQPYGHLPLIYQNPTTRVKLYKVQ